MLQQSREVAPGATRRARSLTGRGSNAPGGRSHGLPTRDCAPRAPGREPLPRRTQGALMAHASSGRAIARDDRRTPAQWYCLLAGLALLLAGIFGFISDSSFETGDGIQGDRFLGFEVNAIHNLIHIGSGLVLLAASPKRASARAVALGFGLVYGLVAIIGLISRNDDRDHERAVIGRDTHSRFQPDAATTRRQRAPR